MSINPMDLDKFDRLNTKISFTNQLKQTNKKLKGKIIKKMESICMLAFFMI